MTEERRVVTVLFSDVVDSTALAENLDPEEVRTLLARYFEVANQVLTEHGGTLEKFIGDAIVGVFGIPQVHGDDTKRAVDAAIELRDRLQKDDRLRGLQVRFGLGTGEVVTTRGSGAEFFVGDAVNVAARLQQAAGAWKILAAERTVRSVGTGYELGPLAQLDIKGKAQPVSAYEIRGRKERRLQPPATRTTFHGRGDELEQLRISAQRAFRERRPAVVSIIAPAGTGKSRLVEEFLSGHASQLSPTPRIATAQCLPYGQHLTYWPLRQMLFQLAEIPDAAPTSQVRQAIAQAIAEPRTAELLALSLGVGEGEAPDQSDVFAAWRRAVETWSASQPLILLFEDLHWSSESLLDLVEVVMQPRGETPVLMIALARPELIDRRPTWGGGRRNFLNLFLEPLAEEDIRSLVGQLLPEYAVERVDQIVVQSDGNPFYAEELVRSVLDRGDASGLPDSIQAAVLARIDLLPEGARRVVQLGSIFGRSFRISGIQALASELPDIEDACERLLNADLVRTGSEDHLDFRHILIREVAYQTLTRAERARLHAAAGDWLESRSTGREDAVAEIVAFHFREALAMRGRQSVPGFDEAATKRRAVAWLRRAGDAASATSAAVEAGRHFQAAIEYASHDELPELYERLGDVEQLRSGSVAAYRRALDLCRSLERPTNQQLRVLAGLLICVQRWWEGVGRMDQEELESLRAYGHRLAATTADENALARFLAADSFYPWHLWRQGLPVAPNAIQTAEASAQRAIEFAERSGEVNAWSAALDGIASCAVLRADWEAARQASLRRLDRRMELGKVERRDAFHMVCDTYICLGDLTGAERVLAEAMTLDWGAESVTLAAILTDQLYVFAMLGRWDEVLAVARQTVKLWRETRAASGPANTAFVIAYEVAHARRDSVMINLLHDALVEVAKEVPHGPYLRAVAERDWPEIQRMMVTPLAGGQAGEAKVERMLATLLDQEQRIDRDVVRRVLDRATERHLPLLEAQARRALAQFDRAIEIWDRAGALPYAARGRIELAQSRGQAPAAGDLAVIRKLRDLRYLETRGLPVEAD